MEVNDAMPWMEQEEMPPAILATLTPLPAELEYRIVYRDLVLLDVAANLVFDVLENALPLTPTGQEVVDPRPAHSGACGLTIRSRREGTARRSPPRRAMS